MDDFEHQTKNDLIIVRHILQGIILSYTIGWGILIFNVGRVPGLPGHYWQVSAVICFGMTVWLAITLSFTALTWWCAIVLSLVTLRSSVYAKEGILNPTGVWLLVLSGIAITGLAVISVNALTGRIGKLK